MDKTKELEVEVIMEMILKQVREEKEFLKLSMSDQILVILGRKQLSEEA